MWRIIVYRKRKLGRCNASIIDDGATNVFSAAIRYTPTAMGMNSVENAMYYALFYTGAFGQTNIHYTAKVTIIPASTVYYEDNFVSYSITTKDGGTTPGGWTPVGSTADSLQDEDRPGSFNLPEADANNLYGFDSSYANCTTYSMGSAMRATVDINTYATASFTFWGTGFDVISVTGGTTGTVMVKIQQLDGSYSKNLIVDTYYGYT